MLLNKQVFDRIQEQCARSVDGDVGPLKCDRWIASSLLHFWAATDAVYSVSCAGGCTDRATFIGDTASAELILKSLSPTIFTRLTEFWSKALGTAKKWGRSHGLIDSALIDKSSDNNAHSTAR